MSDNPARPYKELDFIWTFQPVADLHPGNMPFVFPLAASEDGQTAALLVPMPATSQVFGNLESLMPRIEAECAYVAIPYHPPEDADPAIYSFGVHLLHVPHETPALGEMLILQQYAGVMWERYRHMAQRFDVE